MNLKHKNSRTEDIQSLNRLQIFNVSTKPSVMFFWVLFLCTFLNAWLFHSTYVYAADTTPPLTTPSPIMGTYGTSQNVSLTCNDGSGSGCTTTYYCLGIGCTPVTEYTNSVEINASTSISFYSKDLDGNSEFVKKYNYIIEPELTYKFEQIWPQLKQPWLFSSPHNTAVDNSGNIYVADTNNNRIQKFDSNGNYLTQWGTYGGGNGQFIFPVGIAVDSSGDVYVSEVGIDRIQKFDRNGNYLMQWGSSGSGNGQFSGPFSIATDASGYVYIVDRNNSRIQKFNSNGTYLSQWGSLGNGDGQFNTPFSVAIDANGYIYVSDTGNNRIQKFDSSGSYQNKWGTEGVADGQFIGPTGIVIDSSDNVYVSETNSRIQMFTGDGIYIAQWGTLGSENGQFNYSWGLSLDVDDNLLVADVYNHRIQKFTKEGTWLNTWGATGTSSGKMDNPHFMAADINNNIYVADTNNNRIQKFDSNGNYLSQLGTKGSGDGQFLFPFGVAVDSNGNIYVADTYNNRIQKFDSGGKYLSKWGSQGNWIGQFDNPQSISVDGNGNIYVADTNNHRIQKFDSNGNYLNQWGTHGNRTGQFDLPQGVVADLDGNVFVADTNNHRIQKYDGSGNFLTDNSISTFFPKGIAVDVGGNIYVTDTNRAISKFTNNLFYLNQLNSQGTGNGEFNYPTGVAVDSIGNVYVTDTNNHRIQKFSPFQIKSIARVIYGNGIISTADTVTVTNGTASFTLVPGDNYQVSETVTGTCPIGAFTGNTYTTGTITTDCVVFFSFVQSTFPLSIYINGSGTVHSEQAIDINCSNGTCIQQYNTGTLIDLIPYPQEGYYLKNWVGCDMFAGLICSVSMSSNKNVTANFSLIAAKIGAEPFDSLDFALKKAGYKAVLKLPSNMLPQPLNYSLYNTLTISGGYESTFNNQIGTSTLSWLTVTTGTLIIDGITIK